FTVHRARALAYESEIALIDLRQHFVSWSREVDAGAQSMIRGDLIDDVRVAHVGEGARPPIHAQVLEAIFSEDANLRRLPFTKVCFQSHDLSLEQRIRSELDLKVLAEVEDLAIEKKK